MKENTLKPIFSYSAKLTEVVCMEYQEQRTALGKLMFNLTVKGSKFLMKHMWLYYILNYTWGILMTIIGWIALGFVRLFLRKKIVEKGKSGPCHYAVFGDNWGGLSLGVNFFAADKMGNYLNHVKHHETGHTFQNAILGPLFPFMVAIPSAIRYWQQEIRSRKGKDTKPYDLIWFEGSATTIGEMYYEETK